MPAWFLEPDSYNFVDGDWLSSELVGMYAMMDFFVGTRMHSVIFAMISSIPVIAISYQGPKAKGIMEDIGISDYIVSIESVNPVILKRKFDALVQNKQALSDKIKRGVTGLIHQLEDWERRIKEECCSDIR